MEETCFKFYEDNGFKKKLCTEVNDLKNEIRSTRLKHIAEHQNIAHYNETIIEALRGSYRTENNLRSCVEQAKASHESDMVSFQQDMEKEAKMRRIIERKLKFSRKKHNIEICHLMEKLRTMSSLLEGQRESQLAVSNSLAMVSPEREERTKAIVVRNNAALAKKEDRYLGKNGEETFMRIKRPRGIRSINMGFISKRFKKGRKRPEF